MERIVSTARSLHGEITVPGDKSISHRAVMIGAISNGVSEISGFLNAADPLSTLSCFHQLGIQHTVEKDKLLIYGKGLYGLHQPTSVLDAGNSGTTIRLMSGILAGQNFSSTITGDQYLRRRPMKRIIEPLTAMGAQITAQENFTAPLIIKGVYPLKAIEYQLPIASAQVKSAILFAGLYADGITRVIEKEPSRNHTERMLGLRSEHIDGSTVISVDGGMHIPARQFLVPGDPSSAAFFIVAGLIVPQSYIVIKNVGLNPTRTGFISILKKMNAQLSIENEREVGGEQIGDVVVQSSEMKTNVTLRGEIIPNIIDEIPILSVAAAFAHGTFSVRDAADLRNKETDRIKAICINLRKMGLEVDEYPDGFAFESKNSIIPNEFNSFDDHRIAMAFGIASLALNGESKILNAECVGISFPEFWNTIELLQQ